MLRLMLLPAVLMSLLCRDICAEPASTSISKYRWHTYALLLTAQDPARLKLGARELETTASADRTLSDFAASALDDFLQGRRDLDADTVAWLAKGLGATGSLRYADLLKSLSKHNERKIADYAKESLAKLRTGAPAFNPADVDMQAALARLEEEKKQAATTGASLFDLHQDVWIEDVFTKLGYPTDTGVATTTKRMPAPIPGRIYMTNLVLEYEEGRVEFSRERGDWYVLRVLPRALPTARSQVLEQGSFTTLDAIRQGLLASDPTVVRATARNAVQLGVTDEAILDTAAWRLAAEMRTTDKFMIDGLSYVCRLLGTSGKSRYRTLLVNVGNNAEHRKLRGYATRMAEALLPDQQVEQYLGGRLPQ